jgi:predicted metal-dependent phosphoesterase TrpH
MIVLSYVDYGMNLGLKRFIFRAGSGIPEEYSKDTNFTVENKRSEVDIDDIVNKLIAYGYVEIFSLHKSDFHAHVLRKGDVVLDFDQSSEEIDPDDKIRRLIYMPNGVTYTSWIDSSSLLFASDIRKVIAGVLNQPNCSNDGKIPAYPSAIVPAQFKEREDIISSGSSFPVDLHVHSINSDGLESMRSTIRKAAKSGIHALAFAEHNFTSPEWEIRRHEAATLGIEMPFPAIEISTVFSEESKAERKFHVLAYGTKLSDPEFQEWVNLPLNLRNNHLQKQVESLRKSGMDIPTFVEMLKGIQPDGRFLHPYKIQMTRTTIAQYVAESLKITPEEAKRKFLPPLDSDVSYSSTLDTIEVIRKVKDLGGIVGLAHPGWDRPINGFTKDWNRVLEIIYFLRRHGMDGVESMSSNHSPDQNRTLLQFGREIGLMVIGGSDYHGKPAQGRVLGQFGLTIREFEAIKNILAKTNNL